MGKLSQHNYTCYPPVHQYVFIFGAWLFPASIKGSIIIMRIIMILASLGSLWAGKRLLQRTNFPIHNLALFALNPLFIIETTGNLHFESLMVFFFLFSLLFVYQSKHIVSSLFFSLACSVKLIPLIFAPLLLKKIRKKSFIYFSAAGIVFIILFLPFYKESVLQNFFSSINLYFQTFEFNASIYYIIREIGYLIKGYNIIKTAGIVLAAISFTGVMLIAYKNKTNKHRSFFNGLLLTLTIYYFLATTVHPWYILPLITLSAFSNYKYNLIWSYTIIFSYYAYSNPDFRENMFLIAIEYIPVYGYLVFELLKQHRAKKTNTLS
jgi:Gpi18-like mannosyltransferase